MIQYIADIDHYNQVIAQIPKVKRLLWIATADLKDLYIEKKSGAVVPLLQILNNLVKKGVEVRLIHAKEPAPRFVKISISIRLCGVEWRDAFVRARMNFIVRCQLFNLVFS